MIINIKKTNADAIVPTRGSKHAAGYDLYACCIDADETGIPANATTKIGTGICVEIPEGYFGAVFARSGIATKEGLRPANCVGVIDSDYRGEIMVALHNDSAESRVIRTGDRIAQLVILPYLAINFREVSTLNDTARGDGGFGSTGVSIKSTQKHNGE